MICIARFPRIERISDDDVRALAGVADRLGCELNHLACSVYFESGFDPSARNKASGATGLIQFMPSTARALGTTCDELATMSFADQLPYVERYLEPHRPFPDLGSVYLSILYPAAVHAPDTYVLGRASGAVYRQNAGLDVDHDGAITRAEVCARVKRYLDAAVELPPREVPELG